MPQAWARRAALPISLLWLPVWLALALSASSLAWMVLWVRPSSGQMPQPAIPALQAPSAGGQPLRQAASPALSAIFTPQVLRWRPQILRWARDYALDPNLIAVVMQIESCGDPTAVSPAGALGLFQVMPYHFEKGEDPLDPDTNARRGLAYLARSLDLAQGDAELALAGYNGGHGVIRRAASSWPQETRRYAAWGTAILSDIQQGKVVSPALQRWMAAGGASLCDRAATAQLP